ncbi:hypothetical protein [Streptomyces microflavus]|uniref:hypothetical protein n=1 Tax=Streptomyces microflavus TaxID=1919 RepID=UPI003B22732D
MKAGPPEGYPVDPDDTLTTQRDEDIVKHNSTVRPDTSTVQRHSYMAALSLAETLLSETTALPTDFTVSAVEWEPGLRRSASTSMTTRTRCGSSPLSSCWR